MVRISLIVNIVVLVPVLFDLMSNRSGMVDACGPDVAALRILISVYLAVQTLYEAVTLLIIWWGP